MLSSWQATHLNGTLLMGRGALSRDLNDTLLMGRGALSHVIILGGYTYQWQIFNGQRCLITYRHPRRTYISMAISHQTWLSLVILTILWFHVAIQTTISSTEASISCKIVTTFVCKVALICLHKPQYAGVGAWRMVTRSDHILSCQVSNIITRFKIVIFDTLQFKSNGSYQVCKALFACSITWSYDPVFWKLTFLFLC